MCTVLSIKLNNHYFGRTLDLEYNYKEQIIITPKDYPLRFRYNKTINNHYSIIGIGIIENNYPLYYDACNEKGVAIAGLNFAGNAIYREIEEDMVNVTPFEFIPYLLSQAESVEDVKKLLENLNMVNINFSENLPLSPLHWMISDENSSIIVEPLENGLKVYDNPVGVLTNNPTFDMQLFNLNNYRNLSVKTPENTFSKNLELDTYSRGMGAIGLPGDLSSASRFVKVAFTRENSFSGASESESVSQFFHILGSVEQQKGLTFILKCGKIIMYRLF